MNVAMLTEDQIIRLGEVPVVIFEGREITNKQLRDNSNRLGNALKSLGIGVGEKVAVTMSNCPEVFESFGAIFRVGAVALPILFVLPEQECRFILQDSEAAAVVTDVVLLEKVVRASEGLEQLRHIIVVGGSFPEMLSYEGLLEDSSSEPEIVNRTPSDDAILMYTAGTTGKPKGVLLTHGNLVAQAESAYAAMELTRPSRSLICLPMAHIYGVGTMNTGNLNEFPESQSVLMRWFEPVECMRLIQEYRIDFFPAVPTMFALILNHPEVDKYDLSSLQDCVSAGAPLPEELRCAFTSRFGCNMRQLYGLTESSGIGAIFVPSMSYKEGSVGKPYPSMEMRIFDDEDNELPPYEIGEIVLRGPQVMKGYWKRPEETAQALRNGWLHTGDMGYLDHEGYLFLTERKKDIIIKGAENIMPRQIEEEIYKHPAVAEAAAIGVSDPIYGEDIVAYVALKPGMDATSEELLQFCREHIPSFKCPREVIILEALPKSSIGKILKRELRSLYARTQGLGRK